MKTISSTWRAKLLKQHKKATGIHIRIWYGRPLDLANPDNGPSPAIIKDIFDDDAEWGKLGNLDSSIERGMNEFTSCDASVIVRDEDGSIEKFISDGYYGTGPNSSVPREVVMEIQASIFGSPFTNEFVRVWTGYIDPLMLSRPDPRRLEIRAYSSSKKADRVDFGLTDEGGRTVRNWSAKDFFTYCADRIPTLCNYGDDEDRELDAFAPAHYDLCDGRRAWNPVSRNRIDGVWKDDFEPPIDGFYKDEVQCEYYQHSKLDDNNIYYLGILQKPAENQATSEDKKVRFWTTYLAMFLVNYTDKKITVVNKFSPDNFDTEIAYRGQRALRLFWPKDSVRCWVLFGDKVEGKSSNDGSFWRAQRMVKVNLYGGVSGNWYVESEYELPPFCNMDGSDTNCSAPDSGGTGEIANNQSKPVMIPLAYKADLVYDTSGNGFLYIIYGDISQMNRYDLFEFNDDGQWRQIQQFRGNIWNKFGMVSYYISACNWTEGSDNFPYEYEKMSTESNITHIHSLVYGGPGSPGPSDFNTYGMGLVLTVDSTVDGLRYVLLIRLGAHQTTEIWEILAAKYWLMDSTYMSSTTPPYRGSYYRRYVSNAYYAYIPLATHHCAGGSGGNPYNTFIRDKESATFNPAISNYTLQYDNAPGPATVYSYDTVQVEYVPAYYRPTFTAAGSENYLPVWLYGIIQLNDFTDPVTGITWPRDETKSGGYFIGYVGMNAGGSDCVWLAVHGRQLPLVNNQVIPPPSSFMVDGLRSGSPNWSRVYAPYLVAYYGSKRYAQPDYQIEHGIWADYLYFVACGNYYKRTVREALNSFCAQYKLVYGLVNIEIFDPNGNLTTFYPHLKTYDRDVANLATGDWGGPGEETITEDQYAEHPVITNWQKYDRVVVRSRGMEWAYGYQQAVNVCSLSCDLLPAQFTMDMARLWYNFLNVARKVARIKTNYLIHLDLMDICLVDGLFDHEVDSQNQYRTAVSKVSFSDQDNTVELELITVPEE